MVLLKLPFRYQPSRNSRSPPGVSSSVATLVAVIETEFPALK